MTLRIFAILNTLPFVYGGEPTVEYILSLVSLFWMYPISTASSLMPVFLEVWLY
jgi:hypothetical protein